MKGIAYYNEIDSYAAQWLRNLINAGHIAPGYVDERSIEDVYPSDLRGFTQCHFFAGIGVWSYALRSAGWGDDRPVWTGSCPCQPFSSAGKGSGFDDERHLWPVWMRLIATCSPSIIFGEQVASKGVIGYGNEGLYGVRGGQTPGSVSEIFRQRKARIEAVMQGVPEGVRENLAVQFDRGAKSSKSEKKPENRDLFEGIQGQESGGLLDFGVQEKEPKEGDCFRSRCPCGSNTRSNIQSDLRGIGGCSFSGGRAGSGVQHTIAGQDRPRQGIHLWECSDSSFCGERDAGGLGGGSGDVNHRAVVEKQGVKNDESRTSGAGDVESNEAARGAWLDLVFDDLEGAGYACAAAAFPAASVGALHIRDRLYWVADASDQRLHGRRSSSPGNGGCPPRQQLEQLCDAGGLGDPKCQGLALGQRVAGVSGGTSGAEPGQAPVGAGVHAGGLADPIGGQHITSGARADQRGLSPGDGGHQGRALPGPTNGHWQNADWLLCRDGKWRPVEPGTFPLAHGATARVGRLRAYGNAICAEAARTFIEAVMETQP